MAIDMKLEVVVVPVSDVDRAKAFYRSAGFREEIDYASGGDFRIVQLTPPGSEASIILGTGISTAVPGSLCDLVLVVHDIDVARAVLVARGVDMGDVFHDRGGIFTHVSSEHQVPGPDPSRRDYASFARFRDPDGNGWILQEVRRRAPGR